MTSRPAFDLMKEEEAARDLYDRIRDHVRSSGPGRRGGTCGMATGFVTGFDPVVESAIGMATRRGNDQQDTIDRLNKLSDVDRVVNAEALVAPNGTQVSTYVRCSNDTAHGHGTVSVPGHELLCPDCAYRVIRAELVVGARIDVGVLL